MRMQMNLESTQNVTPQMIASITVLQCGAQELSEYLEEMSYENPLMDLQEPEQPPLEQTELLDKLRWLKSSDRQNRTYYTEGDRDSLDQYLGDPRKEQLSDYLEEQILTMDVTLEVRTAMETVADLLDEKGLFTDSTPEIARLADCSLETAEQALHLVQTLEPQGVAATSIQNALMVQLLNLSPRKRLAERLVSEQYRHLGAWSDLRLARALGASEEAVRAAKRDISRLNPYPANGFAGREDIQYVTPDLHILPAEDGLQVTVEDRYLPTIKINPEYLRMLETQDDPEVRHYLRQKMSQLEQVMYNVDRRKSTLLRCGEIIAERQAAFFSGGSIAKLTLRDVAEELELHESTVSRAIKHKYILCQRGLFPMSHFFGREAGQNYGMCRSGIQSVLAEIIEAEDKRKPLSDERLVTELSRRHIKLSRRAVAKYRMELGFPSSSGRKQIKTT